MNVYLPARIPRGFAPGMNGGESNFSDRGAFSEASEYLEALPRGSLFAFFAGAFHLLAFGGDHQRAALFAFFARRLVPKGEIAIRVRRTAVKYFALLGFLFHYVPVFALRAGNFRFERRFCRSYVFRVFAFRELGASIEFAKPSHFDYQIRAAFGADLVGHFSCFIGFSTSVYLISKLALNGS